MSGNENGGQVLQGDPWANDPIVINTVVRLAWLRMSPGTEILL